MENKLLDTNVLLRFLVGDNKEQQSLAEKFFNQGQKSEFNIIVYPLVIAEAAFVLESHYNKKRSEIASKMQVLLSQRWLKVKNRAALLSLWDDYLDGLRFVDSFLLNQAKIDSASLLSFDKELLDLAE